MHGLGTPGPDRLQVSTAKVLPVVRGAEARDIHGPGTPVEGTFTPQRPVSSDLGQRLPSVELAVVATAQPSCRRVQGALIELALFDRLVVPVGCEFLAPVPLLVVGITELPCVDRSAAPFEGTFLLFSCSHTATVPHVSLKSSGPGAGILA